MSVSSELPLAAENVPPGLFAEGAQRVEPRYVEDEEFPSDLPVKYDWMLQPAFQRTSRRVLGLVAVMVAALLLAVSVFLVYYVQIVYVSVGLAVVLVAVVPAVAGGGV